MDNHLAKIILAIEETLPDPEQILARLIFQWNTRTDAGVDKQIIAFVMHQRKAAQKIQVGLGKATGEAVSEPFPAARVELRIADIDTVVSQCGIATVVHPGIAAPWIVQEFQQKTS